MCESISSILGLDKTVRRTLITSYLLHLLDGTRLINKREMELETENEKLREALINSLHFPEIDERKNSLASPAPTTSRWIFHGSSQDSISPSCVSNHDSFEQSSGLDIRNAENED